MSIQDDIFDIDAALEGKPEAKAFNRVLSFYFNIERENKRLKPFRNVVFEMANLVVKEHNRMAEDEVE